VRFLPATHHRRMPWKNGGGETVEIAVSPQGAGLDDFDWRVSMARVERDGPFSSFPGVERTIAILDGEGITLYVEGRVPLGLMRRFSPVTFPADVPTSCRLIAGPITDLNVMSRRGRVEHSVEPLFLDSELELDIVEADTLLLCLDGALTAASDGFSERLALHDCLVWGGAPGMLQLSPHDAATLAVIEFRHS
jgi:environmental stress-induced protein Ves